uniref:Cdc42 effector protein 1 n=1 Tax=Geotrypetes seraphini TaxID=260995 RepID=A0A6P8PUM1_GEOSA|nr:cdc42 effector protein 1 [Geotrypetes seraphini]XP_033785797.1 cdc42 effector protein 1 [Geotrypetes seraphini]
MSLGKLPVIKSLVASSHNKRRMRPELTLDMIGPPMGDFRHTMHVGRGGDVFGDTSFLSNHGGTPESGKDNFFLRTLRQVRKSPLRSQQRREEAPPPPVSPIIKNAISLPQLNKPAKETNEKFTFKSNPASPSSEAHQHYGLESGFCTIPRLSRTEKTLENSPTLGVKSKVDDQLFDSLQSFKLDFGPSLLSEFLEVISFPEEGVNDNTKLAATQCCNGEQEVPTIDSRNASPHHRYHESHFDVSPRSKFNHIPWEKDETAEPLPTAPHRVQVTLNGCHPSALECKGPLESPSEEKKINLSKGSPCSRSINVIQGHESVSFGQKPGAMIPTQKPIYDSGEMCKANFGNRPQVLAHESSKMGSAIASTRQDSEEEDTCSSEEEKEEEEEEEKEEEEVGGQEESPRSKESSLRERSQYATLQNDSFAYADEDDEIKV